jgi:H+/gluconate symporter-like permease
MIWALWAVMVVGMLRGIGVFFFAVLVSNSI